MMPLIKEKKVVSITAQPQVFLLLETAAGFALLHLKKWDAVAQNLVPAQDSYLEYQNFAKTVDVKAILLFSEAEVALSCCQAIASGVSNETLRNFLSQNLPSQKSSYLLACIDPALGKDLSQYDFHILYDKNVLEITRLCRFHVSKLVKAFQNQHLVKFQVGLSHNYTRTKLNLEVYRQDKPVQNAISIIENLDKALNTFAMRAKEWYGWHFPELGKILTDNIKLAQVIHLIGVKDEFTEERFPELVETLDNDEVLAREIMKVKDISMGQDFTDVDMMYIRNFTSQVIELDQQRKNLAEYLSSKLENVAPNLQTLLGDTLAAKLISHSGSLTNLAKCPASTIQILGAEKALFRALKNKGKTPKYGLLFQSSFIGRAAAKNKGRISRYLANKCSLAARIDNFSSVPTKVFGEKMKEQVEGRMNYLSSGLLTRKNLEGMQEAYKKYQEQLNILEKKKKTHSKKRKFGDSDMLVYNKSKIQRLEKSAKKAKPECSEVEEHDLQLETRQKEKKKTKDISECAEGILETKKKSEKKREKKKKHRKCEM